ncbi:MAG: hypothetical protein V3T17_02440 [Pseudomonadales bacterium]
MALEKYAQLAQNNEAERKAGEIRLRAERKAGQLLKATAKQAGARGKPGPGRGNKNGVVPVDPVLDEPKPLLDMGISKDQSSNWQITPVGTI